MAGKEEAGLRNAQLIARRAGWRSEPGSLGVQRAIQIFKLIAAKFIKPFSSQRKKCH